MNGVLMWCEPSGAPYVGCLHTDERARAHVTLLIDPGVLVAELTLALTPQPLLRKERDVGPKFSGSSPDFLCRLQPGGKEAVRKAP